MSFYDNLVNGATKLFSYSPLGIGLKAGSNFLGSLFEPSSTPSYTNNLNNIDNFLTKYSSILNSNSAFAYQQSINSLRESNAFNSAEAEKNRAFNSMQADKLNAFNSAEAEKARAFNSAEAEKARAFNSDEAEKARSWSESMANTSYQRAVNDLKSAGLNPILAYSNGGAATPSGSAAAAAAASGPSASGSSASGSSASSAGYVNFNKSEIKDILSELIKYTTNSANLEINDKMAKIAKEQNNINAFGTLAGFAGNVLKTVVSSVVGS